MTKKYYRDIAENVEIRATFGVYNTVSTVTARQLVDAINKAANGKPLEHFAFYSDEYTGEDRIVDLDTMEEFILTGDAVGISPVRTVDIIKGDIACRNETYKGVQPAVFNGDLIRQTNEGVTFDGSKGA